jgi:hypothetical protein
MALGTNHVTNTTAATFIPEIWSDEIIAAYEKSLVLANLVNRMPMTGKKGDTIHIPKPTRGDASAKSASTQVTLIAATESEVQVAIDQHYEYSRLIEDITDVQALSSLRQFYTSDAGYALAKQVDSDLFALAKSFGDSDGADYVHSNSFYMDNSTGLTAYAVDTVAAADVFSDDGSVPLSSSWTTMTYRWISVSSLFLLQSFKPFVVNSVMFLQILFQDKLL